MYTVENQFKFEFASGFGSTDWHPMIALEADGITVSGWGFVPGSQRPVPIEGARHYQDPVFQDPMNIYNWEQNPEERPKVFRISPFWEALERLVAGSPEPEEVEEVENDAPKSDGGDHPKAIKTRFGVKYDDNFKANCVHLVVEEGLSYQEAARQTGAGVNSIMKWVKAATAQTEG